MKNERIHTRTKAVRRTVTDARKQLVLFFAAFFFIFAACSVFGNLIISAHGNQTEDPVNFTYYKSISIQPGDTLWDIAESYMTADYNSVSDYIIALKEMNALSTDDIHAGQNLLVAYNDTDFVKE